MNRLLALRIALALVGVLFLALAYPLRMTFRADPAVAMMLSLYVTLGIFLLLAIRDPWPHRSLIAFTAWSSLAHAAVMGAQAALHIVEHSELIGVYILLAIGIALLALAPPRPLTEST